MSLPGHVLSTLNHTNRTSQLLTQHIDLLHDSLRKARHAHPFASVTTVELLNHLHATWTLPCGDRDYPPRWPLIKAGC
jgi:putative transposase